MKPAETRINELHRKHREIALEMQALEHRGLDYTTAYLKLRLRFRLIEAELSVLVEKLPPRS